MKKILLAVICLVTLNSVSAQSFSLLDTNGVAINAGSTVTFQGDPSDAVITARIDVRNISGTDKNVKVKKYHISILDGTMNYFCWGVCYGPDTYESPFAQTIKAGDISDQFYGDYSPMNVSGTTRVMYTFFDVDNRIDSVSLYVEFTAGSAPSQSFSLQDTNGVGIDAGSTFYISGDPTDEIITARIDIKNNSGVTKDVKVKKVHTAVLPNTMNYFCWGVCYGPDTFESPFSQSLAAGVVSDQFYGDYSPLGVVGSSTIMYTFFDANDPTDSVSVYVEFSAAYPPMQSFTLQDTNGVAINAGSTIVITGEPTTDLLKARINVKNTSEFSKDVKVKKYETNILANTSNYFCWGVCYGPDTYESPFAQTLEASAVNDQFYGEYSPQNVTGLSTIMYTFFDANNRDDSVAVYVQFNASPNAIDENIADGIIFSEAYPNPAISKVNIDYNLPASVNKATIRITNMLGAKVKESGLQNQSGTARIEVSELQNGIYFYSLVADDQLVLTRKFIVKH